MKDCYEEETSWLGKCYVIEDYLSEHIYKFNWDVQFHSRVIGYYLEELEVEGVEVIRKISCYIDLLDENIQ